MALQNITKTKDVLVTPKLIEVARVLVGKSLSLKEIKYINKGRLDLLSGIVLTISFSKDIDGLIKFEIQTQSGDIFTFVDNKKPLKKGKKNEGWNMFVADFNAVRLYIQGFCSPEKKALKLVRNLDLLNRLKIITVRNIEIYEKEIIEAFNFGQLISCVYDRVGKSIYALQIQSNVKKEPILDIKLQTQQVNQSSRPHIPLPIDLELEGNFTENQIFAFRKAAQRWGSIIHNNLTPITINGKRIEGISITARALEIDGPKKRLAQAGPTQLRPDSQLPVTGVMEFDSADLKLMEENGSLLNVIIHEMAHVLGFGTLWKQKGLLQGIGTNDPTFIGENSMREYAKLITETQPIEVPLENMGRAGTQYDHWREAVFGNELMTGFLGNLPNPLSRMTIASLQDIGYTCNYDMADIFQVPSRFELEISRDLRSKRSCQCCSICINKAPSILSTYKVSSNI